MGLLNKQLPTLILEVPVCDAFKASMTFGGSSRNTAGFSTWKVPVLVQSMNSSAAVLG